MALSEQQSVVGKNGTLVAHGSDSLAVVSWLARRLVFFPLPPEMLLAKTNAGVQPAWSRRSETDVWDQSAGKHAAVTNEWQSLTGVASCQRRTHGT